MKRMGTVMSQTRNQLIQEAIKHLEEAGFDLSSQCDVRPSCFDLVARKGEQLILVKVLSNIDTLTEEDAKSLHLVAHFFNATPLVIGKRTRRGTLDEGVVYKRFGVSTIAPPTFEGLVSERKMPREFIQRGGRFVAIDGAKLKEVRMSLDMTKKELAKCTEVSTRAILAYEKDEMDVSKDVAEHLEEVLETDLIIPIDILRNPLREPEQIQRVSEVTYLEERVNQFFERLGMKVLWTDRAPFHVAAKEEGPPIMTGVGSITSSRIQKRMSILKSVSDVTRLDSLIIAEESKVEKNLTEVPVIRQHELDDIDESKELRKIIHERSQN
jgi:putative transcriptional regulator